MAIDKNYLRLPSESASSGESTETCTENYDAWLDPYM
jgi:hypothetical protein